MNFMKRIFTLLLLGSLIFACKSDKKDAVSEAAEDAVEAVEDAGEAAADAVEEGAEAVGDAVEEGAEAVEEGAEAVGDAVEEAAEAVGDAAQAATQKSLVVHYPRDSKLANETEKAIKRLYQSNPTIKQHFYDAHGFAVYPVITKGGLGIGGAGGKGLVFENYKVIGGASLAQATIGLQAGGQQYMEVIFFEDKAALDRFKEGKIKFSGQASAVALKDGASVDVDYQDGVAVFTKAKGGLMAEASLGGQKFKYKDGVN
jgi:lipid-binding SYLF domain-containing protein